MIKYINIYLFYMTHYREKKYWEVRQYTEKHVWILILLLFQNLGYAQFVNGSWKNGSTIWETWRVRYCECMYCIVCVGLGVEMLVLVNFGSEWYLENIISSRHVNSVNPKKKKKSNTGQQTRYYNNIWCKFEL